jgi:opacity protein-like surface antigen
MMKKFRIITITLSALLVSTNLISQNESFLGLSFGAVLPQGLFAQKVYENEQSGYANTGFLFTLDGAIFPDDYLGIGATFSYGSNNIEKNQFRDDLISDILTRYPRITEFDYSLIYDFGVWRYLNLHVGPNITFAAGKFNFDIRGLAGLSVVWLPDLDIQINHQDEEIFSRRTDQKGASTLGYTAGGGIRYAMKSGYVIRINTDYSNCKPTFDVSENVIESIRNGQEPGIIKVEKPVKNIQLGIGIAYNFNI